MALRFYLKGEGQFSTKQLNAFQECLVCYLLTLSVDKMI